MPAESAAFDLERILRTLERHGVEYVLVGALGARAHGATRPTEDVDFVPFAGSDNLDRLADALRELGARLAGWGHDRRSGQGAARGGRRPDACRVREHNVGDGCRVDRCAPRLAGRDGSARLDELFERSTTARLDGIALRVAALADIIDSKRHADRAKDREALPELDELHRRRLSPPQT